jgi:Na+/H+ antiporter NhaC
VTEPGLLSLLPPVVALGAALLTRNVVLSLALGCFGGFVLAAGGNPYLGLVAFIEQGLFDQLAQPSHAALLILILTIGGFVGLLERSGGMVTFARRIAALVKGPLGAQLAVWAAGIGIFFSDSATPLILGPIFRPVLRRVQISEEKLAYIIDSTASPVCVLVPFISWGVYVMSLIDQAFTQHKITAYGDSFATFLRMLPFQFYPVLALATVPLLIISGRDFGPMATAQRRLAAAQRRLVEGGNLEAVDDPKPEGDSELAAAPAAPAAVIVVPLLTLLVAVAAFFGVSYALEGALTGAGIKTSLTLAYAVGTLAAIIILRCSGTMGPAESLKAFRGGVEKILLIPLILLLAWSLGHSCQLVGTGRFLAEVCQRSLSPTLLPAMLFLAGAVISFSMGSAWGTFAILMPIAVSIAHGMEVSPIPPMAAVLSGGLFGDHASPISDTTILASMGSGCRHIDHVKTQLPYALLPAAISVGAYIVAARWESAWLLPICLGFTAVATLILARRLGSPSGATPEKLL